MVKSMPLVMIWKIASTLMGSRVDTCYDRVYILSSKQTYRPMRARVVAQLFYKTRYDTKKNCVSITKGKKITALFPVFAMHPFNRVVFKSTARVL